MKKNRRVLDTTEEEEDVVSGGSGSCSASGSPPDTVDVDSVLTSPRREMRRKVRQISQGVEDINWQGSHDTSSDKESEEDLDLDDVVASTIVEVPNGNVAVHEAQEKDEESRPKTPDDDSVHSAPDIRNLNPDALIQSPVRSGPIEDSGRLRAYSESNEKGLKRKFLERGTSQGPSEESPSEPLKRPRDDADKDDNPREAKRPSPPPPPPRPSSPPKGSKPVSFLSTSLEFFSSRNLEFRADS